MPLQVSGTRTEQASTDCTDVQNPTAASRGVYGGEMTADDPGLVGLQQQFVYSIEHFESAPSVRSLALGM